MMVTRIMNIDGHPFQVERRRAVKGDAYLGRASLIATWSDKEPSREPKDVLEPMSVGARNRAGYPRSRALRVV